MMTARIHKKMAAALLTAVLLMGLFPATVLQAEDVSDPAIVTVSEEDSLDPSSEDKPSAEDNVSESEDDEEVSEDLPNEPNSDSEMFEDNNYIDIEVEEDADEDTGAPITTGIRLRSLGSVGTLAALKQAIEDASGETTITLSANITFADWSDEIVIPNGKNIIINGGGYTINGNGRRIFSVAGGGELTLSNITVTGGNVGAREYVTGDHVGGGIFNAGTLNLNEGCLITGNGPSFDINYPNDNAVTKGGGIRNEGTLNINGAVIKNNNAIYGGGISNAEEGVVNFYRGEISGNNAYIGGGVDNNGKFYMSGGKITDNNAVLGGGVYTGHDLNNIDEGDTPLFKISGGEISGNKGKDNDDKEIDDNIYNHNPSDHPSDLIYESVTTTSTTSTATTAASTTTTTTVPGTTTSTTTRPASRPPYYPYPNYPYPYYPSTGGGYYGGGSGGIATMPMPADPAQPSDPNTYQYYDYRAASSSLADLLHQMGLLYGTGVDGDGKINYELTRPLSRMEALAIVIRLTGLEQKANAYTGTNPFTDTPAWGDRICAYGYSQGITVGVNKTNTLFAPDRNVTYQEFTAFLLRVLGYSEKNGDFAYADALNKAVEIALYSAQERRTFSSGTEYLRADAVVGMVNALLTKTKGSQSRLIDKLISDGVIRKEAANTFISGVSAVHNRY